MKTQKLTLTQLMQDAEVIEKENLNSIKGGQQEVTYKGGTLQEVTITGTRTNSLFNFQSQTVDWTRYYHSKGAEFLFNLESSDVVGGGGGNANPHTGYSWYDCPVENPPASPIGDPIKDAIEKN